MDALRKKYASSDAGGSKEKETIRISGKTVEEVGFEKINQQLASLHELRIVILDGLSIRGILPRRNISYTQDWTQEVERLKQLGMDCFNLAEATA